MEGLPEEIAHRYAELPLDSLDPHNPVFENFVSTLDVVICDSIVKPAEGERAAYLPSARTVHRPPFGLFFSTPDYYLTLAHELIHWADDSTTQVATGITNSSAIRAWRELVAEFSAVFVCDELGVEGVPVALPEGYVSLWRKRGKLSETDAIDAVEAAATLTKWLLQVAPGRALECSWESDAEALSLRTCQAFTYALPVG